MTSAQEQVGGAKALLGDVALMAQISGGDPDAFRALARRYGSPLLGFAAKVLGNQSGAEDVVQDAFIKLWQRPDLYDPAKAKFSTWMHRVVLNRCLDQKRKPVGLDVDMIAERPSDAPTPEQQASTNSRDAALHRAMADLPERQRAALALCYLDGMSNAEAADILEVHIKALESLLSRARTNLRATLTPMKEDLL